jgi:hypothetical protein
LFISALLRKPGGVFRLILGMAAGAGLFVATRSPSEAIPLFAQRYRMRCTVCHSVLPVLNAFGNYFRNHGYRLPNAPVHGTTGVALRYQMEYEETPPSGQRRWTPGGVLLSNANIGNITAYLHYNLGAGGGPSAVYLGYLASFNQHTQTTVRAGYVELPLVQSPGQRLDDLQGYGYYTTRVGLNDLTLAAPRLGIEAERQVGLARIDATLAFGEFKGAAYGGKPINTGEATYPGQPEVGVFATVPTLPGLDLLGTAMLGQRAITVQGQPQFQDAYQRYSFGLQTHGRKLDLTAQQWYGFDGDADGFGNSITSSGGFARLRYWLSAHSYAAIRYDTAANPFISRDVVYYVGTSFGTPARIVIQDVHQIGLGKNFLGGALTFGFPWPLHY